MKKRTYLQFFSRSRHFSSFLADCFTVSVASTAKFRPKQRDSRELDTEDVIFFATFLRCVTSVLTFLLKYCIRFCTDLQFL